ncbi:hypothetical protein G5T42_17170 [Microbacterium sp. 4R-513]|uniref:hypothetical protein n=1 Tax=Microbacterium sp. 4R-513 TaxID=2567934 RepID=UPI0013E1E19D|nr:hypothetical protein [Microbacterium sp. 4R-513]QIG40990.1 hypothetical protein G5T42_17170 [Microbacterium sp. 4R-513]
MIFAIGFSRDGSVVARKPLGVAAMGVVALWPLVTTTVPAMLATVIPGSDDRLLMWGYASILITFAAGLTAAVEIVRSGVVPGPGKWAPLVALGVQVLAWLLPQLLAVGGGLADPATFVGLSNGLGTLSILARTFCLGIVGFAVTEARTRQDPGVRLQGIISARRVGGTEERIGA